MGIATRKTEGIVFNIQKYSLHDGSGIRTLVFLKGCPLRCRCCSNPESQSPQPELVYNSSKCLTLAKCTMCLEVCEPAALVAVDGALVHVDRDRCDGCLECAHTCPAGALNVYGEVRTVDEVLTAVEEDGVFYSRSGGGMTLSGGEPMFQPEFAVALLREARFRRINTAMETCGHCHWEALEEACRNLDSLLFDIKSLDPDKHRAFTGVSNERILANFARIGESFPELPVVVRTPVIPGFNDKEQDIAAIVEFLEERPAVSYELLPYHRMGTPKYAYLGREYPLGDAVLDDEVMARLNRLLRR
jgi:pyruvate formate lyase activating enzyme